MLCTTRRFPIREYGVNYAAQPLQSHEIQAMRRDKDVMARVLQSYRIMLDFYGMQLVSPDTGLLARVERESKYEERYRNLIRTSSLSFIHLSSSSSPLLTSFIFQTHNTTSSASPASSSASPKWASNG